MWEDSIKMWEDAMKWRLHGFTDAESSEGGIPKTRNKRKRSKKNYWCPGKNL